MSGLRAAGLAVTRPVVSLKVAAWTWASVRALGPSLQTDGIEAVDRVRRPPSAPVGHRAAVDGLLTVMHASCLVRSAVLQRWDADHDRSRPLVIGVAREDGRIVAHAWLEGEESGDDFVELHRRPPAPS